MVGFRCGPGTNRIVRLQGLVETTLTASCSDGYLTDSGLQPATSYCYRLEFGGDTLQSCATTTHRPFMFDGPAISQQQSDQMVANFDWRQTDAVMATRDTPATGPRPTLYSMNVLVKNAEDLVSMRRLGIHTQTQPLLSDEQAAWNGTTVRAMSHGAPVGVWITAVVPGPIYNDLRRQALAGIASGQPIGIRAMVFRKINIPAAALDPISPTVSSLNPTYLGQMGIAFNGQSAETCWEGPPRACQIQSAILGWLASKSITLLFDLGQAVYDTVRQAIGIVESIIRGNVDIAIQLVLKNTDEAFGVGEVARSGWRGTPLVLSGIPVKVYQGLAEFTNTTNAEGVAAIRVSSGLSGKVCIELDSPRVRIVDTFVEREVCIGTFSATRTCGPTSSPRWATPPAI
jgi:hypothetical protein